MSQVIIAIFTMLSSSLIALSRAQDQQQQAIPKKPTPYREAIVGRGTTEPPVFIVTPYVIFRWFMFQTCGSIVLICLYKLWHRDWFSRTFGKCYNWVGRNNRFARFHRSEERKLKCAEGRVLESINKPSRETYAKQYASQVIDGQERGVAIRILTAKNVLPPEYNPFDLSRPPDCYKLIGSREQQYLQVMDNSQMMNQTIPDSSLSIPSQVMNTDQSLSINSQTMSTMTNDSAQSQMSVSSATTFDSALSNNSQMNISSTAILDSAPTFLEMNSSSQMVAPLPNSTIQTDKTKSVEGNNAELENAKDRESFIFQDFDGDSVSDSSSSDDSSSNNAQQKSIHDKLNHLQAPTTRKKVVELDNSDLELGDENYYVRDDIFSDAKAAIGSKAGHQYYLESEAMMRAPYMNDVRSKQKTAEIFLFDNEPDIKPISKQSKKKKKKSKKQPVNVEKNQFEEMFARHPYVMKSIRKKKKENKAKVAEREIGNVIVDEVEMMETNGRQNF